VDEICAGFPEIAEYRVRIRETDSLVEMALGLEPVQDVANPQLLARDVAAALKSRLTLTVPVTLEPPGTLERFEMKARRWQRVCG
jgi:phenylacetate-CoA ligase